MTIEFTILGSVCSANRVTRGLAFVRNGKAVMRATKSKEARDDTDRIKGIAFAAKVQQGWFVPERACVEIEAYGSRLDADNVAKTICDSIKGNLLIVDDRPKHLKSIYVEHMDGAAKEYYVVRVIACAKP